MKNTILKFFEPAALTSLAAGLILGSTAVCMAYQSREPERIYIPMPVAQVPEAVVQVGPVETALPEEPDPYELELMAVAIYREAGGDACCDECRYRVGDVILNRVADPRFPDNIEGVLTQPGQYAGDVRTWPARAYLPGEAQAVARAWDTARDVLTDEHHSDLYGQGYIYQSTQLGLGSSEGRVKCCGQYFAKG